MSLETTEELQPEERAILTLKGHLDATTAPDLKARLKDLIAAGYILLVLELTNVPFIDSAGLAALISTLKTAREAGGTVRLVGLSGHPRTVFRVTLLDRIFDSYPDVRTALDDSLAP